MSHPARISGKRDQVRSFVLEQIGAGLSPGDRLWTEHALADRLGVSKSTVRKAIEDLVAAGVIYQEQGRGTFVRDDRHPLVLARSRQAVQMLGYVSPWALDDRFMREITLGVEESLDHDRFLLMQKHIHIPTFREEDVLPRIVEKVQGLILLSTMTAGAREYLALLNERRYPLVLIDRYLPDLPVTFVGTDNEEVGRIATEHLLDLGHRQILHLTFDDGMSSCREREAGYVATMRRHGLKPWVHYCRPEAGLAAIVNHLLADELPTAIFALNDAMAIQVCEALRERCVGVPDEISVIGVDNNPDADRALVPLTTVAQPKYQIGHRAAELLQALIAGSVKPGRAILLQPNLVVRQSTREVRR